MNRWAKFIWIFTWRTQFEDKIIIIEFKLAPTSKDVPAKKKEGEEQIKKYVPAYKDISSFINEGEKKLSNKKIITAVFVADDEQRPSDFVEN